MCKENKTYELASCKGLERKATESKAFVFDFDDTLATTEAKIYITVGGVLTKTLTPAEFTAYPLGSNERIDLRDFRSLGLIENGKPTELMKLAQEVYNEGHSVYVLTARNKVVTDAIAEFLGQFGIAAKTIFCVGRTPTTDIARAKRRVLMGIIENYDTTYFFDDDERNIELAKDLDCKRKKVDIV